MPMILDLSPSRMDNTLEAAVAGEVLVLNGIPHDLSAVPEGGAADAASPWIAGPVRRIAGVLHVPLILPLGPDAPEAARYPAPLAVAADGPVALPGTAA